MKKVCLNIILIFGLGLSGLAQNKYWVYFTSKTWPENSISDQNEAALRDVPVHALFLDSLAANGIQPVIQSKWLNAISAYLDQDDMAFLSTLSFVDRVSPTIHTKKTTHAIEVVSHPTEANFITVLKQINGDAIIDFGLNGEGVTIGIIDGGFLGANESEALSDIFYENQVKLFRDFTGQNYYAFGGDKLYKDDHGTKVWQYIGGYERNNDRYRGLSTHSAFYLAKTDRGDREFRGEEDFWIAAIEWMDSLGIKLINSSVGYSTGFDNPDEDYLPSDADGKTSAISQAAQIAADEKNILIVVSSGNDGNKGHQVVSMPGDAQGVLTVGASTAKTFKRMNYSSIGSTFTSYPKPDIVCYSLGGTSYSAPTITGLAACIMQFNPRLNNLEIINIIKKSSHLYPYANNYVGYGVPDARKVLAILQNPAVETWQAVEVKATKQVITLPADGMTGTVLYHKASDITVIEEVEIKSENDQFIITNDTGAIRSTIAIGRKVYEIFWPN